MTDKRHRRNYARKISRLPRWSHRLWARLFGYFWLPCPMCGEQFGGHEWRDIDGKSSTVSVVGYKQIFAGADIFRESTSSKGICPACTREGLGDHGVVEIIPSIFGALPR